MHLYIKHISVCIFDYIYINIWYTRINKNIIVALAILEHPVRQVMQHTLSAIAYCHSKAVIHKARSWEFRPFHFSTKYLVDIGRPS